MVSVSKRTIGGDSRDRSRVDPTVASHGRREAGSIRGVHKGACPAALKAGDLVSDGRVLIGVLDGGRRPRRRFPGALEGSRQKLWYDFTTSAKPRSGLT